MELALLDGDCGQFDPELWFADERNKQDQRYAKGVCSGCTKLAECQGKILDYEFETNETLYGIYGGLTERERRAYRLRQKKKGA
jgi:hypothetical protein